MKKRTPKLLLTVGAPGSGKTTYAQELLRTEMGWFRVNRDEFRAMQFEGTKASASTERAVNIAMETCIEVYLNKNYNVIVDATHCRLEYIQRYIKRFGHLADIHFKLFELPFDTLMERCKQRELLTGKVIPEDVLHVLLKELEILKSNFDFKPRSKTKKVFEPLHQSADLPTCFLFDLDGTLAQADHRTMFNPSAEAILDDKPILPVISVLQSLAKEHQIIFLSGREEAVYDSTLAWLKQYTLCSGDILLYMRKLGDYRRDSIVKREILKEHILPHYRVLGAFDDRLQVVRECWNAEGIFCFNVNQLLEEF